ncbi:MAG: hypothetical protein ACTSQG_05220 [Promethearchaeota archaeon]
MVNIKRKIDKSVSRLKNSRNEINSVSNDPLFQVGNNMQTQMDSWSWYYQELSTLRVRIERLGFAVRINNQDSPNFLDPYLSEMMSFFIKVGIVIDNTTYVKIYDLYLEIRKEINEFMIKRNIIHNKKIPFDLICKMDKFQRIILLIAQKKGLLIRIAEGTDSNKAIDDAITGN